MPLPSFRSGAAPFVTLAAALLVAGALGYALGARRPAPPVHPPEGSGAVDVVSARGAPGADGAAGPGEGAAPPPPASALPPEAEQYPEHFADLEGREETEEVPPRVEYPVYDKLVAEPLSPVGHEVLGAWDEARESATPGRRRALVLVVSPGASDAEIESLARDVRARHSDAPLLDVRIYDDAGAARTSRVVDGGRSAFRHLVGQVRRNETLELDVIRVRGRRVGP